MSGADGNITIKTKQNTLIATPSKINKAFLNEEILMETDMNGKLISGSGKVTSEINMHTLIYKIREDVGAVIHTHAPYITAFAARGENIPDNVLIEVAVIIGRVALVDFALPGTIDVAKSIEPYIKQNNAILLKNHGVVVYGANIEEAYNRLESLENAAKSIILSRILGEPTLIPKDMVEKMYLRK